MADSVAACLDLLDYRTMFMLNLSVSRFRESRLWCPFVAGRRRSARKRWRT